MGNLGKHTGNGQLVCSVRDEEAMILVFVLFPYGSLVKQRLDLKTVSELRQPSRIPICKVTQSTTTIKHIMKIFTCCP